MPVQKLKAYLYEHNVKYVSLQHFQAFTAQKIAAAAHIPGKDLAKTVIVKLAGKMAMAVLPPSFKVNLAALRDLAGVSSAELATERNSEVYFPTAKSAPCHPSETFICKMICTS